MISTDDWCQISDLMGRYVMLIDEADGENWASLWTEDGVMSGSQPEPVVGRAALVAAGNAIRDMFGRGMRHILSGLTCDYVDGDRDHVRARFYNHMTLFIELSGTLGIAICDARMVRQDGVWKIKSSQIELLMPKAAA